ncbi:hypothetical protein [Pseudoalteromonas sp. MMG006]
MYSLDINNDEQRIEFIRQTGDTEYYPVGLVKWGKMKCQPWMLIYRHMA